MCKRNAEIKWALFFGAWRPRNYHTEVLIHQQTMDVTYNDVFYSSVKSKESNEWLVASLTTEALPELIELAKLKATCEKKF